MVLPWCTSVPVPVASLAKLASYTLTPSATSASLELTILTPLAPISAFPLRFTEPVDVVVTVELFAAMLPPEASPAVTLSIWLSFSGCFVLDVLWP